MVRHRTEDGTGWYHEPPYTWEEEQEIYRRMDYSGPIKILHQGPRPAAAPTELPQTEPPLPEEQ
jgi:hypothetical protein